MPADEWQPMQLSVAKTRVLIPGLTGVVPLFRGEVQIGGLRGVAGRAVDVARHLRLVAGRLVHLIGLLARRIDMSALEIGFHGDVGQEDGGRLTARLVGDRIGETGVPGRRAVSPGQSAIACR